jgi:glycosyltransferase involved in cell wall biosynthesis
VSLPLLSIVVPTYNRRRILSRTLPSLLAQKVAGGQYEVIVVVDGSTDGTAEMLSRAGWRTRLRVVSQPNRGLAAARNRGAAEARGEIVLFLDDDMLVGDDVVGIHLDEHGTGGPKVVLGALGLAEGARRSFLTEGVAAWSRDMERRLSEPGYRLRFDDWSFGHASIHRALFLSLGGFDESFVSYGNEDYELGWRLTQREVETRFAPRAVARQIYDKSFAAWLEDVRCVGRADVVLAAKYPAIAADLRLSRREGHPLKRLARWSGLAAFDPLAPAWGALAGVLMLAERLSLRGVFLSHGQSLMGERVYWRGVRDARESAPPAIFGAMKRPGRAA